ncbi:MAG: adenylosuccinate synthase, partial [Clostridiaceae bacterium]|nr:adenylosuccinate synthase [Clostridiaceae bacterium]
MHPVIIGTQWGDEGKGKLVDLLASNPTIKAIVRYQGGNNAGHTVVVKGEKYAFHLLPSGILYRDKVCVLGNGVIINPLVLLKELTALEKRTGGSYAKVLISSKCGLIMPWHIICDSLVAEELGTTSRGIGPAYTDLYARRGIRLADTKSKTLFIQKVEKEISWYKEYINLLLAFHKVPQEKLASLKLDAEFNVESVVSAYWNALETIKSNSLVTIGGVSEFLEQIETSGKAILFEGAQATLLDIAHGTYPYVTSSYPTTGGLYIGTGFRPK